MDHLLIGGLGSRDTWDNIRMVGGCGVYSQDLAHYWQYIDEFAIYPKVLSPCRIAAHYAAWQPRDCNEFWDRKMEEPPAVDVDRTQDCKIDLNKQGNDVAYSGIGAYSGGSNLWRVYYGGYPETLGKAMGSSRTADLRDSDEPCMPSTYAAQVWISADVNDANYETYGPVDGNGLMDDGFRKKTGATGDPCIILWGRGAYGGMGSNYITYDLYVYGNDAGSFTLTSPGRNETNSVVGGIPPGGGFVPGKNYVVFKDVSIGADSNVAILKYTNKLNGLQLVKKLRAVVKAPVVIQDGAEVNATEYDVAYETNQRSGETTYFGPDSGTITTVTDENVPAVMYLDGGEYMEYDIYVADGNDGNYQIDAYVNIANGECDNLYVSIDGVELGSLRFIRGQTGIPADNQFYWTYETPGFAGEGFIHQSVTCYIFKGNHTFKWRVGGLQGFNLAKFKFNYVGPLDVDCNDVKFYHLNYPSDFTGDCHVDFEDFAVMADNWAYCYDLDLNGPDYPDLNRDCRIDFYDFASFATDWMKCNDPCDPDCTPNW